MRHTLRTTPCPRRGRRDDWERPLGPRIRIDTYALSEMTKWRDLSAQSFVQRWYQYGATGQPGPKSVLLNRRKSTARSLNSGIESASALWENGMLMSGKWLGAAAVALMVATAAPAQTWKQVGPPGGTVITIDADPHDINRLFLGTSDGHVFASTDEGQHWQMVSRIGTGQDDVVTHILVDPRNKNRLYASTWTLYSGGGGVYRSDDGGRTWNLIGLGKETVRALAQAPTNPKILVAGALSGVYRSTDEGKNWERITPAGHHDLSRFDSVAFDPKDENIIYAGTYHLPWKTVDGGKNWTSIKAGMIDDSDVMSIIVDPANPENVHATACSGIYHSVNSAQQ